jgi:hypothetical protein
MASSNEYTEYYGRIDFNEKLIRDILFNHAKDNKGDDNFGISPENRILNENKQIFIKNYETLKDLFKKNNPYLIHVIENTYSEKGQSLDSNYGNYVTFNYVEIIFIDNYCNYYIVKGYKNGIGRFKNGYLSMKITSPNEFIIKKQSTHKLSNDLIDDIKKIKPIQNINFQDGMKKFIENNPLYDIINIYFTLHQKNKNIIYQHKKKHTFKYNANESSDVYITGTFNNWEKIKMTNENNIWKYDIDLDEGTYEYKFIINDEWKHDEKQPIITNNGIINNIIIL